MKTPAILALNRTTVGFMCTIYCTTLKSYHTYMKTKLKWTAFICCFQVRRHAGADGLRSDRHVAKLRYVLNALVAMVTDELEVTNVLMAINVYTD